MFIVTLLRYLAHRLMRGITAFLQRVLRIIFIFKTILKIVKCKKDEIMIVPLLAGAAKTVVVSMLSERVVLRVLLKLA